MRKDLFIAAALAAGLLSSAAFAQVGGPGIPAGQNVVPVCGAAGPNVGPTIPAGTYRNAGVQVTGFALAFTHCQTTMFIQAAGTLATGALTTEPNPIDGQRECFASNQIQTALTWTAHSGQTLATTADPPAALGAPVCQAYVASLGAWFPSP